ncbi:MAG: phage tail tape measure protein [Elusimicrobia bacterium]|nr:phage tail tape measure protein [Elusimicrobiota bacterium]
MGETMKVALTFTAIDAASGYLADMERRIDSLGESGKKLRGDYDAMKSHFAEGLKGFGVAFSTMQFMKPGIEAAAMLEASGLSVKNSLWESGKTAAAMGAEFTKMRSTALYLSAHSPFGAPDIMRAEQLLLESGFKPGEIAGQNGLAASVSGMSQLSGQSMEEVRDLVDIFHQQFGANLKEINSAFDAIAQNGLEDKLPYLTSGLLSVGTRASDMVIPLKDVVSTLGMMHTVARRAAPALGEFLKSMRPDATSHEAVMMRDIGFNGYNAKGKFIGFEAIQKELKEKFGGFKTDLLPLLERVFGAGAPVAKALIDAKPLAEINAQNERRLKFEAKLKEVNDGLTTSYEEMIRAMKNAEGSVFAPITEMLAAGARGGRDTFVWLGKLAENHPGVSAGVAGLGGLVAAGGAAYGLWGMGKALMGLKSIATGLAGAGAAVTAGKALAGTGMMGEEMVLGGTAAAGAGMAITLGDLLAIPLATYGVYKGEEWLNERLRRINFGAAGIPGADNIHLSDKNIPEININFNTDIKGRVTASTGQGVDLKVNTNNRGNFHYYDEKHP